jgi:hypothetical protein
MGYVTKQEFVATHGDFMSLRRFVPCDCGDKGCKERQIKDVSSGCISPLNGSTIKIATIPCAFYLESGTEITNNKHVSSPRNDALWVQRLAWFMAVLYYHLKIK